MKTRLLVLTCFFFLAPSLAAQAQQTLPAPVEPEAATEAAPQPFAETAPQPGAPLGETPLQPGTPLPETQLQPGVSLPETQIQPGAPLPYGEGLDAEPGFTAPPPVPVYELQPGTSALAVLTSLSKLLNRGGNRRFFGLPEDANWRVEQGLRIAVYSDQREEVVPFLKAAAMRFSEATSLPIELVMARRLLAVAGAETARQATGANLEILFGPRALMGQFAGGIAMNRTVLTRFLDGRWPFGFVMPREQSWTGRVFIAREEPSEAIEASLVLALVWALGGVSLGDELQGLVDPFAVEPTLTPLGQSVFSLMYHPKLEAGLTISETLERAQQLVQQGRITAEQPLQ